MTAQTYAERTLPRLSLEQLSTLIVQAAETLAIRGESARAEAALHNAMRTITVGAGGEITMAAIISDVALTHGVSADEITGRLTRADIVLSRHEAMWRCRQVGKWSLPQIGRKFGGRDHSSVKYAIDKIEALFEAGEFIP